MGQCANNRIKKTKDMQGDKADTYSSLVWDLNQQKNENPQLNRKSSLKKLSDLKKPYSIDRSQNITYKVAVSQQNTIQFEWRNSPFTCFNSKLAQMSISSIKEAEFQEKLSWFKQKIVDLKHDHRHGCHTIEVDRDNIIESSLVALEEINLLKQIKIKFHGENAQDAGGGLMRQWMHLCVKQILKSSVGIFRKSSGTDIAYSLIPNNSASDELTTQALSLLGMIYAKALIENISINCPLDFTLLRQLVDQPLHLSDFFSYNQKMAQSILFLKNMKDASDLGLYGTVLLTQDEAKVTEIELFQGGKYTPITNQNKEMYISAMVNYECCSKIQAQIIAIRDSIKGIIPLDILAIFQPWELDSIVTGQPTIVLEDLKNNTVYEDYQKDENIIGWFWEIVEKSGQQGYRNLLHYCTGSRGVPVAGFSNLETTYGHIKKFSIRRIKFSEHNPFPKSHTCFNRLDLPTYSSKQELEKYLRFILEDQFTFFGLC